MELFAARRVERQYARERAERAYTVSTDAALSTMSVRVCFEDTPPRRIGPGVRDADRALIEAVDDAGHPLPTELAELVPEVVEWNEGPLGLGARAGHPLRDARTELVLGDVSARTRAARDRYDAILLDVDNGPIALAHASNDSLYGARGHRRVLVGASRGRRPGRVVPRRRSALHAAARAPRVRCACRARVRLAQGPRPRARDLDRAPALTHYALYSAYGESVLCRPFARETREKG